VQIIDDPLHVLAIGAEVASEPRNRLWAFCRNNGSTSL
jgi:hypothetical protein